VEKSPGLQITRICTDEDGESHFEDREIPVSPADFAPPAPPLNVSSPVPTDQMVIVEIPAGWDGDWHPAPRRQYWIGMVGRLEVTVTDGETRRFGPGDVVLLEDLTGKGHVTRTLDGGGAQGLFVQL
jgi:quercetin dioxygenase-like cupin family protein